MPGYPNIPSHRKPRPLTPTEIINKEIKPYDLLDRGNPNITPNRGDDVSVRSDINKEVTISLEDFFLAIKVYIQDKIKPTIIEGGQQIPVPVEYASSERWFAAQKEGFLRDREGRALLPVITMKRANIVRNRDLGSKLDGNKVHNYQVFQTQYNRKNIYDNFSLLTNRIPVKEYRIAPVPDYVIVTYNCSIFCNMQEDIDRIIQSFIFAADAYWGEYDRFRFKVNIEEFTDSIEYSQGEDRSVRSDFNIVLNGYLLPDSVNRETAIQKKILSKASLKFTLETMYTSNGSNKLPVTVVDSYIHQSAVPAITPAVFTYFQTDIEMVNVSGSITPNSVTFPAGFLTAPAPFPPTSVSNFTFFANGQYLNATSLISFTDNGNGTSTLVVNTGSANTGGLGFSFGSDWQLVARGKFN